jgi:hypothetical protein
MLLSSTSASNNLYITGGQLTGNAGTNADYWNPRAYGPNSEVWITVATKPNVDQDPVVLGLRFQNPGLSTATGYQAYYAYRSKPPDQWKIVVRTAASASITSGAWTSARGRGFSARAIAPSRAPATSTSPRATAP